MDQKGSDNQPLFKNSSGQEESFYDTIENSTPEYDNQVNQNVEPMDEETCRQQEEWRQELVKLEDEIATLRSVLGVKVHQAAVLKHKLGITPMTEFKHDMKQGLQNIKESDAYQKTNEKIKDVSETITHSDAYQKTTQSFSTFKQFASKKLGDVRNSNTFKSFEEKMGGAYTSVKTKMRGSKSENSFDEALHAAEADADHHSDNTAANSATNPVAGEEKIPL